MLAIAPGCELEVQRGPDLLVVRIKNFDPTEPDSSSLVDRIWNILEQHFTYRLVLEMDEVPLLNSDLIDQLIDLSWRIEKRDGVLRLCGLSPANLRVLRACRLDKRLPPYRDSQEAVMGRPRQPR
ncbi:MAG: STAS domain-containing protein [Pirellulaceae bacterium]|nr:STAS domain-containing protein [Pirellulaceae bacterium]